MRQSYRIALVLALSLALPSFALAISLDTPTGNLNVDANGNASINNGNAGINVNTNTGTTNLNNGSANIQASPSGVNLNNGAANINVNNTTGLIKLNVNGQTVSINPKEGGLQVQISSGKISGDAKTAILSLSNGTDALITSDADLQTYNSIVMESRPGVTSIKTSDSEVRVGYKQEGRFLGIIKMILNGTVVVDNNGAVSIELPWYSFLFTKNTQTTKTTITSNLSSAQLNVSGSSNNSVVTGTSTNGTATLNVKSKAKTVNIISSAVSGPSVNISK